MKIAFDARTITPHKHGLSRYAENLLRHLAELDEIDLVAIYQPHYLTPWEQPRTTWVSCSAPILSPKGQMLLPWLLQQHQPDLYHSPSFMLPMMIPCPWVMTLCDLIHVRYAQDYGWTQHWYYRWLKHKLSQAHGILTISEYSRRDILDWLGPSFKKPVYVTYLGVEPNFKPTHKPAILGKYGLDKPYLLFVGNPKPHKNFKLLYDAFVLFTEKHGPVAQLVTIGVGHWSAPEDIPLQSLKSVPDEDLPALYSEARALICPSLSEGFGLPALEAMACGTPVLVADAASLPEVVGNAALLFNPKREMALVECLEMILFDTGLNRHLKQKGLQQAQRFSFEQMAQETLAFYRQVLAP